MSVHQFSPNPLQAMYIRSHSKGRQRGEGITKNIDKKWQKLQLLLPPVLHFSCFDKSQKICKWFPPQKLLFYLLVSENRRPLCNRKQIKSFSFYKEVNHFPSKCGTPLYIFVEHFSKTLFSVFAEYLSVVLQNISQHFFRTHLSIFAEHISVVLQNTTCTYLRSCLSIFS